MTWSNADRAVKPNFH